MDKAALESSLNTLDIWLIAFGVLVAVGVVGESVAGFLHWRRSNQLQAMQTAENLSLRTEITRLGAEAETSRAAIAQSDARAAEATRKAAEAQLALERLKTPRTLGPARRQAVADAIRPFAGQRYRAAISQGADDGVAFWESLYATLQSAGWAYIPAGGPSMGDPPAGIPIAAIPGIEIRFDPARQRELAPAALALGNALHVDGTVVAVNRDRESNPNNPESDALFIAIGARVPPQ